jgi:hypothetical protein
MGKYARVTNWGRKPSGHKKACRCTSAKTDNSRDADSSKHTSRVCACVQRTGAAARESLRRDRPDGLTSPALPACGGASPFRTCCCHRSQKRISFSWEPHHVSRADSTEHTKAELMRTLPKFSRPKAIHGVHKHAHRSHVCGRLITRAHRMSDKYPQSGCIPLLLKLVNAGLDLYTVV